MSGKAILFLVMSFSVIFLVMGRNLGDISTRSVINSVTYYDNTVAHEIAVSAANIAASKICFNTLWADGFHNVPFNGGTFNVTVTPNGEQRIVTATGVYKDTVAEVKIILSPSKFSKYAYYSAIETDDPLHPIYWMTKDTVWGPFHTQDYIYVSGCPVFYGKVTTKKGVKKYTNDQIPDNPRFLGGYQQVPLDLPTTGITKVRDNAVNNGGKLFSLISTSTVQYQDFYLTFKGDSVNYTYNWKEKVSGSWHNRTTNLTVLTENLTSNGVIFFEGKDKNGAIINMRLKGTVDGEYTVGTDASIYLDDDIVYKDDPRTEPSDDILGIVAKNDVIIANNTANNHSINIDAAIYSQSGGFTAENYDTRGKAGSINLYGGVTQQTRKPVGTFSGDNILSGFSKRYWYDPRLMTLSPPYYPGTDKFEILSWYE
ncbi:MAG TPA: hypothetical protein VMT35_16980 [Ignavibacteriaceae bacterium]|nr:hypothetical protein [Ignavibacteriaceae bacterium]